jgi:heptaprenyl diphosphate synthase
VAYLPEPVNVVELLELPSLEEDLVRLEDCLRRSIGAEDPFLAEVAGHLVSAGGKRLRPALSLAAAAVGGAPATEEVLLGGVSVELVHLASLYHDDVMDEAATRRNVESVNSRWGNLVAIVAGDFLLARSAEIAAGLGTEIAALLAATLGRLCEGQVGEVRSAYDTGRTESAYLSAIAGKTASLMATSCRIGALTAGLDRRQVDALTTFGQCFGMAFQLRDDILDVVASAEELGKEPGQDLVSGIYTLPVLLALAHPDHGPELRSLLGRPLEVPERDKARAIVVASGAVAATAEAGQRYSAAAAAAAESIDSPQIAAGLARLGHALMENVERP